MVLFLHSEEEYSVAWHYAEHIREYDQMVENQSVSLRQVSILAVHQPLKILDPVQILIELLKRGALGVCIMLKREGEKLLVTEDLLFHLGVLGDEYLCIKIEESARNSSLLDSYVGMQLRSEEQLIICKICTSHGMIASCVSIL